MNNKLFILVFIFSLNSLVAMKSNEENLEPFPIMLLPDDLKLEVIVSHIKDSKNQYEFEDNLCGILRLSQANKFFYDFIIIKHKDTIFNSVNNNDCIKYILWHAIALEEFNKANFLVTKHNVNRLKFKFEHSLLQEAMSFSRRANFVKLLIARKADINYQDAVGTTALMKAAFDQNLDYVKLLLKNNADITIKNKKGQTALSLAREQEIPEFMNSRKIITLLEEKEKK